MWKNHPPKYANYIFVWNEVYTYFNKLFDTITMPLIRKFLKENMKKLID